MIKIYFSFIEHKNLFFVHFIYYPIFIVFYEFLWYLNKLF